MATGAVVTAGAGVVGARGGARAGCGVFMHPVQATSSTSVIAIVARIGFFMYDDLPVVI
jgi:hypothetical protein